MLIRSQGANEYFLSGQMVFPHKISSARVTVEAFFHTCSTQMCGERGFTRATGKSEYPRQDSNLRLPL